MNINELRKAVGGFHAEPGFFAGEKSPLLTRESTGGAGYLSGAGYLTYLNNCSGGAGYLTYLNNCLGDLFEVPNWYFKSVHWLYKVPI
jgi:hypothetical protein